MRKSSLSPFFPLNRIRFDGFVTHGHFIDIGVPDDYARAQIELASV